MPGAGEADVSNDRAPNANGQQRGTTPKPNHL